MEFLRRFAGFFIRQENMDGSGTDNEDRLSSLPDSMLCEILLKLSTKDVVRTSVLSNRWRNLWRSVPGLDLSCDDLREYNTFVSFVDRFLGFNSELCIENLKVKYQLGSAHVTRWINDVVKRRVKHLSVIAYHWSINGAHIPSTVYTCESLVTLELREATLLSPKFVFLPCLKVISLIRVKFANNLAFEMLISGSPLLESLSLVTISFENINCFRVCSESLLRLTHFENYSIGEDLVIAIDAPRLRYLKLSDYDTTCVPCFIVKDLGSLVKVDMDIVFKLGYGRSFDPNDLPRINMIRDFFNGISTAKDMVISSRTLEVIYDYLRCQPLPLFPNLSSMRITDYKWQMLPAFLESFPRLKRLFLESCRNPPEKEGISISSGRPCFLSSLEYVEIQKPWTNPQRKENLLSSKHRLVSYFVENSTLCLDDSTKEGESLILRRPLTTPRLSASCPVNNPQEIDSILG